MNFEPFLHKVLLRQEVAATKKELDERLQNMPKGFVVAGEESLAEAKRDQASVDIGVVISWGPTAYRDYKTDLPITVGQRVVIAKYAGKLVRVGEEDLLLVNDEDILGGYKETDNG